MRNYPSDWYWSGGPGVYGSARGGVVSNPSTDSAYLAWLTGGNPTVWPRDNGGSQTAAALDAVLTGAGLPASGLVAPTQAQLLSYAYAKIGGLLAVSRVYALGSGVSVKCDATTQTGADLAGVNAWGTTAPTATTSWVDDFGVSKTITGAQAVTLANAVVAYGQSAYNELGVVTTSILAGTTTTYAQIDATAWPA